VRSAPRAECTICDALCSAPMAWCYSALDIQFLLGHVSVQTTERYLGCKQRIRSAVNDRIGIEPDLRDCGVPAQNGEAGDAGKLALRL